MLINKMFINFSSFISKKEIFVKDRSLACIILFLLLFNITNLSFCNDYYLAPGGNDSASGDINNPWATISKANTVLAAGDTVYFRTGTYQDVIYPSNSGSAGAKITYKGYPGEDVLITGVPNQAGVVFLGHNPQNGDWTSRSYIVIEDISIKNNYLPVSTSCENIRIYGQDTHDIEIRNVKILRDDSETQIYTSWVAGHRENGILLMKAHHNIIENCDIGGLTKIGIMIGSGAHHNIIRNNDIIDTFHNCINIGNGNYTYQGNLIEDNYLCGSLTSDGIQFEPDYDAVPEEDESSNQGVIIRNNTLCYNAENALDLKGTCKILIEGNLIFGNMGDNNGYVSILAYDVNNNMTYSDQDGGGAIMHGANTKSKEIIIRKNFIYDNNAGILVDKGYKIYNNVILNNSRNWEGPNSTYTRTRRPPYTGLTYLRDLSLLKSSVKNNIIGDHPVCEINLWTAIGYNLETNNNIYYNSDQVLFCEYRDKYDWDLISLSQWQPFLQGITGISGCELDSFVVNGPDDIFVDIPSNPINTVAKDDYKQKFLSTAINQGAFLTYTIGNGSGTQITLNDTGYFHAGFDIIDGDTIQLSGQLQTAKITDIDYVNNTITLDQTLTWTDNQEISLCYNGLTPDIGSYEYDKTQLYLELDETSGVNATDSSGNNNDGGLNMSSSTPWVTGKVGNALDFDGLSDHVSVSNSPSLNITDAITIAAWVKVDTLGSVMSIVDKGYNTYSIGVSSSGKFMVSYRNQTSTNVNSYGSTNVQIGTWYHVAGVIDSGGNVKLYVNGGTPERDVAFVGTSINSNSGSLFVGAGGSSGNNYNFDGIIDDVRIYNCALTGDEVNALSIAAHFKLDRIAGNNAGDTSVYKNNAELEMSSSTPWVAGHIGNALDFDGLSDYVYVPNSSSLNITDVITIAAWVKVDTLGSNVEIVNKYWNTYSIGISSNGKFKISYRNQNGTNINNYGSTNVQADTWYHVAGIIDSGGNVKLYVNGGNPELDVAFIGTSINSNNGDLLIGAGGSSGNYYNLDGMIDDVRIYNRPLTGSEISTLANQ